MASGTPRYVVLEEVEWLTSFGVHPLRIAEQLGIKPAGIARSLHRSGRGDLASRFDPRNMR